MKIKPDVYDRVTNLIVAALQRAEEKRKAGQEWRCPWVNVAGGGQPMNLYGRPYSGMNFVLLSILSSVYPSQLFGTYKSWGLKGAQVRKGEKSTIVIFAKPIERDEIDKKTGKKKKFWLVRGYPVFAAEQVDGFDLPVYLKAREAALPDVAQRYEAADIAFDAYCEAEKLLVEYGGNRACYETVIDKVRMPLKKAFKSTEDFYSTLAHELGHSTGHKKRLDRGLSTTSREEYAFEELVAELSASMTCAILGLEQVPREDHADYLSRWIERLHDDNRAIFRAAAQAQKATNLVLKSLQLQVEDEGKMELAA